MSLGTAATQQPERSLFNTSSKMWDQLANELTPPSNPTENSQTTQQPPANTTTQNTTTTETKQEVKPETTQAETTTEQTAKAETKVEVQQPVEQPKVTIQMSEEDRSHLNFLEGNESNEGQEVTTKDKPSKKELDAETKTKLAEYERILANPMISAISEFVKNGGNDLNEFINKTGITDPAKLTIKDLYATQAQGLGMTGEELTEAVEEQMARYESMSKIDQKKIEKELRDGASKNQAERLSAFATDARTQNEEFSKIAQTAHKSLEEKVNALEGKKWKGLLIDENISKEIRSIASNYALPIQDEKGRIVGYDTESAIDFAIWKASGNGRKLLKANYEMGLTKGKEEILKERTRVSDNPATTSIPTAKSTADNLDDAIKDKASGVGRTVSLSKGVK